MSILSKMMRIAGRGDDGTAKAISTTNDGIIKTQLENDVNVGNFPETQNVQLKGSNVELTLLDGEEFRESGFSAVDIDLSEYKDIDFMITNTLDQPVNITIDVNGSAPRMFENDGTVRRYFPPINSFHSFTYHTVPMAVYNSLLSWLPLKEDVTDKLPFKNLKSSNARLIYHCEIAPTSGSLTIVLLGGKY